MVIRSATSRERFSNAAAIRSYPWGHLAAAVPVLGLIVTASSMIGSVHVPVADVLAAVASRPAGTDSTQTELTRVIVWEIRLPRILLAGLVGSALALAGATYQALFRTPLADPYLLGVASGAGLGATLILTTSLPSVFLGLSLLPVAGFLGGVLAVSTAYLFARQGGGLPSTNLILAGVAVGALAGALTSILLLFSEPDPRPVLGWLLGNLGGAQWRHVWVLLPYVIPAAVATISLGRLLNVLQLSDEEARLLGVPVDRLKLALIATASLLTAAAVSVSGLIGFVGLIAPHVVRMIWGADNRFVLPMSALVGAGFLMLADLVARSAAAPSEIPVGIVTALCGAPFFLFLIRRRRAG